MDFGLGGRLGIPCQRTGKNQFFSNFQCVSQPKWVFLRKKKTVLRLSDARGGVL